MGFQAEYISSTVIFKRKKQENCIKKTGYSVLPYPVRNRLEKTIT